MLDSSQMAWEVMDPILTSAQLVFILIYSITISIHNLPMAQTYICAFK